LLLWPKFFDNELKFNFQKGKDPTENWDNAQKTFGMEMFPDDIKTAVKCSSDSEVTFPMASGIPFLRRLVTFAVGPCSWSVLNQDVSRKNSTKVIQPYLCTLAEKGAESRYAVDVEKDTVLFFNQPLSSEKFPAIDKLIQSETWSMSYFEDLKPAVGTGLHNDLTGKDVTIELILGNYSFFNSDGGPAFPFLSKLQGDDACPKFLTIKELATDWSWYIFGMLKPKKRLQARYCEWFMDNLKTKTASAAAAGSAASAMPAQSTMPDGEHASSNIINEHAECLTKQLNNETKYLSEPMTVPLHCVFPLEGYALMADVQARQFNVDFYLSLLESMKKFPAFGKYQKEAAYVVFENMQQILDFMRGGVEVQEEDLEAILKTYSSFKEDFEQDAVTLASKAAVQVDDRSRNEEMKNLLRAWGTARQGKSRVWRLQDTSQTHKAWMDKVDEDAFPESFIERYLTVDSQQVEDFSHITGPFCFPVAGGHSSAAAIRLMDKALEELNAMESHNDGNSASRPVVPPSIPAAMCTRVGRLIHWSVLIRDRDFIRRTAKLDNQTSTMTGGEKSIEVYETCRRQAKLAGLVLDQTYFMQKGSLHTNDDKLVQEANTWTEHRNEKGTVFVIVPAGDPKKALINSSVYSALEGEKDKRLLEARVRELQVRTLYLNRIMCCIGFSVVLPPCTVHGGLVCNVPFCCHPGDVCKGSYAAKLVRVSSWTGRFVSLDSK